MAGIKITPQKVNQDEKNIEFCPRWKDNIKLQKTNQMEIGNLTEIEIRIMIVKMIQDFGKRMEANIEKMQEIITSDLEELKNKQRWTIYLEGINSRTTEAEEQISVLKDRMVEIAVTEQNIGKRRKKMKTA